MSQKKTKPYVDILKFFFAGCIVFLHYGLVDALPHSELICATVIRLAVPYFFVASGYFWAQKMIRAETRLDGKQITQRYCKRLGVKLLIFEPILILLHAAFSLYNKVPLDEILITHIKEILFYPGLLWYVQGVIVATLLLMPIVQRKAERYAIIPALLLYIFAILNNRYHFLIEGTPVGSFYSWYEEIFISTRNGLFVGFPFMLGGCLIARYEDRFLAPGKQQTAKLALLTGASFVLCIVEYFLICPYSGHDDNALYFSYLILIPALFALSAQMEGLRVDTTVLRNLSTSFYLLHSPVKRTCMIFLRVVLNIDSIWILAAISVVVMLVICAIIYKKKWQPFYRWII